MRDHERVLLATYELELGLSTPDELDPAPLGRTRPLLVQALIALGAAAASMFTVRYGIDLGLRPPEGVDLRA